MSGLVSSLDTCVLRQTAIQQYFGPLLRGEGWNNCRRSRWLAKSTDDELK